MVLRGREALRERSRAADIGEQEGSLDFRFRHGAWSCSWKHSIAPVRVPASDGRLPMSRITGAPGPVNGCAAHQAAGLGREMSEHPASASVRVAALLEEVVPEFLALGGDGARPRVRILLGHALAGPQRVDRSNHTCGPPQVEVQLDPSGLLDEALDRWAVHLPVHPGGSAVLRNIRRRSSRFRPGSPCRPTWSRRADRRCHRRNCPGPSRQRTAGSPR